MAKFLEVKDTSYDFQLGLINVGEDLLFDALNEVLLHEDSELYEKVADLYESEDHTLNMSLCDLNTLSSEELLLLEGLESFDEEEYQTLTCLQAAYVLTTDEENASDEEPPKKPALAAKLIFSSDPNIKKFAVSWFP